MRFVALLNKLELLFSGTLIVIASAYSKVRYRGSTFRPFVRPSVNNSCQGALLCSSDS